MFAVGAVVILMVIELSPRTFKNTVVIKIVASLITNGRLLRVAPAVCAEISAEAKVTVVEPYT